MKVGIVVFPGSNCDHDAFYALSENLGQQTAFLWHQETNLGQIDAIVLPGGFSHGDYLRCGAIAKFSPVMEAVKRFAAEGGPVLGICNGFQILTECGLLPGALVRNQNLKFICRTAALTVASNQSMFTQNLSPGQRINLPVAHGEGCYVADERTLDQLEAEDQVMLRYVDNWNGSQRGIAGILNNGRNVMGMMPHPERAADSLLGNQDGRLIFQSLAAAVTQSVSLAAKS